jgi:hypothetical protein
MFDDYRPTEKTLKKRNLIFIGFITLIVLFVTLFAAINYVKRTPQRVSAHYKKKVFNEVRQFVIEYPSEHLSFLDAVFINSDQYHQKVNEAIVKEFGEEKYEIFKSVYDSMRSENRIRTDSLFGGVYKLHVARDSLWQNLKHKYLYK